MGEIPHSHRLRVGRVDEPGLIYLLTANCHGRQRPLKGPRAATIVLEALHWLDREGRMELLAAVVMPDHFHFVAVLRQPSLHRLMHSLKSYSAQRINEAREAQGRLWQSGYHDHSLRSEESLNEVIEYCLQNPQRAGLVADFHDYPQWWCEWTM